MAKHRAVIIGAGRIGAGFQFDYPNFIYTHVGAYLALNSRVELVGFVEPDIERAMAATAKYDLPNFKSLDEAPDFDIVSVCTPPERHAEDLVLAMKRAGNRLKGCWMEKPFTAIGDLPCPLPIQVNYWRRFCKVHQTIKTLLQGRQSFLTVWAKDDIHTRCHFDDLKKFWGCGGMAYFDNQGEIPQTNSYEVTTGKMTFQFKHGGIVEGGFMEAALRNLLDTVDGRATLISPP